MKILALDQASRITGYAIFDNKKLINSGLISLGDNHLGQRLVHLREEVTKLVKQYDVEFILLEDIQYQANFGFDTFKILGEVLGSLEELAMELVGTNYEVVPSVRWKSKLGIKGKKRADQKKNAQLYVQDTYDKKVTQDESDAICIGSYYINKDKTITDEDFNWE